MYKLTHTILIPILIFLLTLNSCKKEKEETPVIVGDVNLEMLHYEFNPVLKIQLQTDSVKKIKFGIDSIDINSDGSFDIFIKQRIYLNWTENISRVLLNKDNFPYLGLSLKNDFEVAYKKVSVYVGLGEYNNVPMVDALNSESRIDRITNWHNSKMDRNSYFGYYNGSIWLWAMSPTIFWPCNLMNTSRYTERYIGIRKKISTGYIQGWIKMKVDSQDNFEILNYAIEK
jgi:hypothetical protein